ncbi:hypothetical protein SLS62_005634 [Diatrype stigma]|uniref:Uncharacterized protein n=1 Tax=Diatrype stigma TaxID=117547 RepID=A0AAN9YPN2_9PEZI
MASIATRIQEAAPRNKELVAVLEATDHAPPTLEHQKQYVADLDRDLSELRKRIGSLEQKREKELKEHEKYRDSVMKRFAYKVARKQDAFEARASKEEQEYLQVLQEAHKAKQQEDSVKAMRAEALAVQHDLEKEVARHTQAQADLDSLYNSIFQGPTPDFPEEDATERSAQAAQQDCDAARARLEAEQQAASLLGQAQARLRTALARIEDALDHSRMDMFGGGTVFDFLERDALQNAESQVGQMQMLAMQAQRCSGGRVQALPPVRISQGSLVGDVLFDNIFSDMEFHDKIKASREEVRRCGAALALQVQLAAARIREQEVEVARLAERRSEARAALQSARQRIFERLASGDSGVAAAAAASAPGDNASSSSYAEGVLPPTPPTPPKDAPLYPEGVAPPPPPKDGGSNELPPAYTP